jgi:membrane protein YdbS with pleckstrin-like domain
MTGRPLDPQFIPLQRAVGWIVTASVAAGSFIALIVFVLVESRSVAVVALLAALWPVAVASLGWFCYRFPELEYRRTWYSVDDHGIQIQRGVYWRELTTVPRSRVQHTDVRQGPLERRYGLGTLVIHTAGIAHARVELPGLAHADALKIRDQLLPLETDDAV